MTERKVNVAACLALAERVERGESGREIDRAVAKATGWRRLTPSQMRNKHGGWVAPGDWLGHPDCLAREVHRDPPAVSTSLDACEALRERLLPGSLIGIDVMQGGALAVLWPHGLHGGCIEGRAPKEPAARLAAILRAVAAQQKENTHA